jgi:hypothetical protein
MLSASTVACAIEYLSRVNARSALVLVSLVASPEQGSYLVSAFTTDNQRGRPQAISIHNTPRCRRPSRDVSCANITISTETTWTPLYTVRHLVGAALLGMPYLVQASLTKRAALQEIAFADDTCVSAHSMNDDEIGNQIGRSLRLFT